MSTDGALRRPQRTLRVTLVGVALAVVVSGWMIVRNENDPAIMLAFGVESPRLVDHAEAVLDREIPLRPGYGHDGRFFFLQALDPLVLEPDQAPTTLLGRPLYRAQRMLLPMVAGGGGLVPAKWLPWTFLLTNLAAVGLGTAATSRVAVRRGGSPWLGLAFAANVGIVIGMGIGSADVLAFATAMAALDQIDRRRTWPAVAWLALAVLAREAMILFALGVALHEWYRSGRLPVRFLAVPAAALSWALYLRMRLPGGSGTSQVIEIGPPLTGVFDAAEHWSLSGVAVLDVVTVLLISVAVAIVVRHAVSDPDPLAWGSAALVLLVVVLARPVWQHYYDISRAAAPILTAAIVLAFSRARPGAGGYSKIAPASSMSFGDALVGDPQSKGGSGSYSMPS